ncbi:hypothetical protein BASA81_006892 [Batrachochytrium salamandrivorans]|nr:hypothetical protein BASA81_006892 [Batrachochytrium salamandrivorans]
MNCDGICPNPHFDESCAGYPTYSATPTLLPTSAVPAPVPFSSNDSRSRPYLNESGEVEGCGSGTLVMAFSIIAGIILIAAQMPDWFKLRKEIKSQGLWQAVRNLSVDANPDAFLDLSYSSYLTTELLNLYSLGAYSEDTTATVFLAAISLPLLSVWLRRQKHLGFASALPIFILAMWSNQDSPELVVLTCLLVALSLAILATQQRLARWKEWASLLVYQALPLVIQIDVITLDDTSLALGCLVILGAVASAALRVWNKEPTLRVVVLEFACIALTQLSLMTQVMRLQVSGICQSSPIAVLDTVVSSFYLPVGVAWTALELKALHEQGKKEETGAFTLTAARAPPPSAKHTLTVVAAPPPPSE